LFGGKEYYFGAIRFGLNEQTCSAIIQSGSYTHIVVVMQVYRTYKGPPAPVHPFCPALAHGPPSWHHSRSVGKRNFEAVRSVQTVPTNAVGFARSRCHACHALPASWLAHCRCCLASQRYLCEQLAHQLPALPLWPCPAMHVLKRAVLCFATH
jgi:hypothetical protein